MEKTFALINGDIVINHVIADESFIEFVKNDYEQIVETTELNPKPGINWMYKDKVFSPAYVVIAKTEPVEETPVE